LVNNRAQQCITRNIITLPTQNLNRWIAASRRYWIVDYEKYLVATGTTEATASDAITQLGMLRTHRAEHCGHRDNGCLQQIAANRFSIPQDFIAILLQGFVRHSLGSLTPGLGRRR
jgi:hypothetical protein